MKQSKFTLAKILTTLCFCLLLMSFTASSAFATNTWIGGVGNWNVPGNWWNGTVNKVPDDTEEVKIITEGDLCTVNTSVPVLVSNKIAIARDATLEIDADGYLKSGNELKVGDAGASGQGSDIGYLVMTGGQLDNTGKLEIGYKLNGDGRATISGGSITGATGRMYVGGASAAGAKGKVTIQGSAATISQQDLYVGASTAAGANPGNGTLEFQIGSAGVSPIGLSGTAYLDPAGALSTATLVLSLTATPPPEQDILLISGTAIGNFDTVNGAPAPEGTLVTLNYGGNGYCYRLTYAGSVVLKWAPAAVSFSVNGPTDPRYDGIQGQWIAMFMPPWAPPPTPVGAGPYPFIRLPAVPRARGIATARIGDVWDYRNGGFVSEAEIFQSEPDTSTGGASNPPNGTNNQILKTVAMGLYPTPVSYKHNINAYSFGEDFFNGDEQPENHSPVYPEEWQYRTGPPFPEPTVAGGGLPIKFYFSVDPWAIGLAGTAVQSEATLAGALTLPVGPPGSADVDTNPPPGAPPYGLGPWRSDGEAASDVFSSEPITAPGQNVLVHDDAILALKAPWSGTDKMEDDLDALETVGTNTLYDGTAAEPGNTHDRVAPTSGVNPPGVHPPDLGDPTNPNHDPINGNPIIFSIDRGSYGAAGSAVTSQVQNPMEGAAGDLFIAVTIINPWSGMLVTTNMLLIDEGQLGLMPHDDLDAVIVKLLIDPNELVMRIESAAWNFDPYNTMGSQGPGFTIPLLNAGEAAVGFSVDTTSIGLMFSAVDFECRFNPSGMIEQAGDVFFANLQPIAGSGIDAGTGIVCSTNYLWFEELALGLDRGAWSLAAPSGDLGDLPDDLDALDSLIGEIPPPKPLVPHLKWSQPPIEIDPNSEIPQYCGWDVMSLRELWEPPEEYWNIVADDFRCLGEMPVTSIHWWGSYIYWEQGGGMPPQLPIGWKMCFWSNVPASPIPGYSYPKQLLWQIEVDANRVEVNEVGTDFYHGYYPEDICYQYTLYLEPTEYFWQGQFEPNTIDNVFWMSISALYPVGSLPPHEYPWGWKTRPWHWMDDAVGFLVWGPLEPGLVLDPANNYMIPIKDPIYQESVDVAFELDTDPCYIKWEQPFTGIRDWPHYEDVPSCWVWDLELLTVAADDWPCKSPLPITAIAWWGSYLGYTYMPCHEPIIRPEQPGHFWISIWTDVPDPDPCDPGNWSHPGEIIWEYNAMDYDEVLVGYDKHPEYDPCGPHEPVFRYSVRIPEGAWFWQEETEAVYWLMIVAVYSHPPEYPWGWTIHKHVYNDDAVVGLPIEFPEIWEWYEIHDQNMQSADMSFILFTDPNAEPPVPPEMDFGDANDPPYPTLLANDGARHIIAGPWLGPANDGPDPEGDGQPDPLALGDDNDGNDDEDGVTIPPLTQGIPTTITVEVSDPAGLGGVVELWIDFNGNGSWNDAGEFVFGGWLLPGLNPIPVTAPIGSVVGHTFGRCRISSQGTGGPTGLALDGEVEDHKVAINAGTDFGDAPDPTYPTLLASNGARHTIVAGVMLGASIDAELDGLPDATATGDDNNGSDDEDGVAFTSLLIPGQQATVDVTASVPGRLNAWIDFYGDGDWSDAIDRIFNNVALTGGGLTDTLAFTVPATAKGNINTFARFRFNTAGGLSYNGQATDGEVEDHTVHIEYKLKWSQPPFEMEPGAYYGWDEPSIYGWMQIVADDWPCKDQRPVTDIHWWGSYYEWTQPMPPQPAPIGFHIGIWTDVPAGIDRPWSHPGIMKWEYYANIAEVREQFVGFDFHPQYPPDTCFKYDLQLPEAKWFWQDPNSNSVYWISIAALYEEIPQMWYWGWKTRPHYSNDDAVRILWPTAPHVNEPFVEGEPIINEEGSWDMAFELTTQECLLGGNAGALEYSDWATWGYPKCWCYKRQCRGDINGLRKFGIWVSLEDLVVLRTAYAKPAAQIPPGGICADLDHKMKFGIRVSLEDLTILRTYYTKPEAQVPVCDLAPIITGPYNFWTTP